MTTPLARPARPPAEAFDTPPRRQLRRPIPRLGARPNLAFAAALALIAYVPLLLTHPGMIGADTKAYLYLHPERLLARATSMWDPNVGAGTVTHENIGYLWPMGPWYRVAAAIGMPTWIAQRLWTGTLLVLAGLGVRWMLGVLGWTGPGTAVAALAYMLSPYVLQYEARISAILMAWTALPWMLGLAIRSLRQGGWRYPALFALVAATAGSVNATCLIYAGLAPLLWFPFAVWGIGEATLRKAIVAVAKIGLLSVLVAAWWIVGLSIQSGYGLNVLRYTETPEVVARTGLPFEAVRGLANWFFYGRDAVGPWVQPASDYTQWGWLLAVSFAVPVLAFAAATLIRWRYKLYFVGLIVVGVTLAVGVHPYNDPSPLGWLFKRFGTGSTLGLALRSTGRAVPLVAIGSAVMLGAGVDVLWRRYRETGLGERTQRRRLALASGASFLVIGLVAADMTPLWIGQFVDNNLQRPSDLPSYWPAAADYLSSQGKEPAGSPGYATRVLELPGADFSHYRWGATLDPVTPGLTDRPVVSREVQPYGTEGSVDLVRAIDRRLQEGVLEPDALPALARKLGVGDILLRSDLQYERFRTPRPRATWQLFNPPPAGLSQPVTFGPPVAETPVIPYTDEVTLGTPTNAPSPPAVAVFGVQDPTSILHTESSNEPMIVAGDGEGMVDAAAAGLLNADQPVLYAADLGKQQAQFQQALNDGADLILTDTNRLQAQRWGTLRENFGFTQQPGVQPLVTDTNNAPLPLFPGAGNDAYTVAQNSSGVIIRASNYGNSVSYAKSERPDLAMDGNSGTTWRVGAFGSVIGERLQVNLPDSVTTDHLTLVQPSQQATTAVPGENPDPDAFRLLPGSRYITKVTVTFDGGRQVTDTLDLRSLRPASGQTISFPKQTFHQLEIRIDDTNTHSLDHRFDNGVGFAEIRIPSVSPQSEMLRLPTDLLQMAGSASLQHRLDVVLTRDRANPAEPFKSDPESSIARTFTLPTARSFSISGTARVSALAPDQEIDRWLGRPDPPIINSSGRLPGDLNARSAMALDDNPATWWSPSTGPQEGQWLSVNLSQPMTLHNWTMKVVADGQHSVPTRLRIQIDDQPGGPVVDLPPITDSSKPGATVDVPVSIPPVTAQHRITVIIDSVRPVKTLDQLSGKKIDLPVGIAELGLPGLSVPPAGASVPGTCRTDLLTVDGKPVGLRVLGSTAQGASRAGLSIQPCGPGVDATGAISLGPGPHVVQTATGRFKGIDIDRLVFGSNRGGTPLAAGAVATTSISAGPAVTVLSQGRTSARVRVTAPSAAPFWLVLGQSLDKGWTAHVDGGPSLGAPRRVDGYANGWLVHGTPGQVLTISLTWTPQSRVRIGLVVSVIAALLCIGLALVSGTRRGPRLVEHPAAYRPWRSPDAPLAGRRRLWIVAGSAALGWLLIGWAAGLIVAAIVAIALNRSRLQVVPALVAVAGIALSGAYVTASQISHHFPLALEWPQHFEAVRELAWVAVLALGIDAFIRHLQARWGARRAPDGPSRRRERPGRDSE